MKIYTKTGDKGQTSLLGGTRVLKSDIRIEAYGTVDELNSYIGLIASFSELKASRNLFTKIQKSLFIIGSQLACESDSLKLKIPQLLPEEALYLEYEIDEIDKKLLPLKGFILPGGHPVIAHCHVARCICRRAERQIVNLTQEQPIPDQIVIYLNRLSDYLFMLARNVSHDLGIIEILWKS